MHKEENMNLLFFEGSFAIPKLFSILLRWKFFNKSVSIQSLSLGFRLLNSFGVITLQTDLHNFSNKQPRFIVNYRPRMKVLLILRRYESGCILPLRHRFHNLEPWKQIHLCGLEISCKYDWLVSQWHENATNLAEVLK